MKISPTFYNDAGELLAPLDLDVNLASATLGGIPPIEAGFYYLFKFEGNSKADYQNKRDRFFRRMHSVQGYMTLTQSEYKVEIGNLVRYGVEVLYAVEDPTGPRNGPWDKVERTMWRVGITSKVQPDAAPTGPAPTRSASTNSAPTMMDIIVGKR